MAASSSDCWTKEKTPQQVVAELYLRCLSRPPTEEEAKAIEEQLAGVTDPQAAVGRRVLGTAQFARVPVQPLMTQSTHELPTLRSPDRSSISRAMASRSLAMHTSFVSLRCCAASSPLCIASRLPAARRRQGHLRRPSRADLPPAVQLVPQSDGEEGRSRRHELSRA